MTPYSLEALMEKCYFKIPMVALKVLQKHSNSRIG